MAGEPLTIPAAPPAVNAPRIAGVGTALAAAGAAATFAFARDVSMDPYPPTAGTLPFAAALTGLVLAVAGAVVSGYAVSRRPSHPATLAIASATAWAGMLAV